MRSSFMRRSLHLEEGTTRRLRRRLVVRGRGSKRFFLGLSSSPSFLSLLFAGGPPSIPGGTFPIVLLVRLVFVVVVCWLIGPFG